MIEPLTKFTWENYKDDCGFMKFVKDPQQTIHMFNHKYKGKSVSWDGYIMKISMNEENSLNFAYHSADIILKMFPDDIEGSHNADIGISFSEKLLTKLKNEIDQYKRGDHIRFNATLLQLGDPGHVHHLHAFDIEKTSGHKDVDAYVMNGGRYKFKQTGEHSH